MAAAVKLEGFEALDEKLHDLIREKGEQILRKGLRAGGEIIQQAAIEMAPERTDGYGGGKSNAKNPAWDLPPGALKSDIGLRVGWDKGTGGLTAFIGPGKFTRNVAEWVEYGHAVVRGGRFSNWGRRGTGQQVGRVKQHPFLRPALEMSEDSAIGAFKELVVSEVEKHMKG
jgi:hypothetical protein